MMLTALRSLRAAKAFPYPRAFQSRAMALMWGAGGTILLLVAAVPAPPEMAGRPIAVIGAVAVVVSTLIAMAGARLAEWAFPFLLLGGTCIVTTLMLLGGGGTASVAFTVFYVWVVVYALLFFSGPVAALQLTGVAVGYTTAHLALGDLPALVPIVLAGTLTITAVVIGGLSRARTEASCDALTQVANRRGIDRFLEQAMQRAAAEAWPLIVAVLDVDHFKQVNDRRGHSAGDRLLQTAVQRWATLLRPDDALGRLGGDEFVVVLPDCGAAQAREVVDRLRETMPAGVTCSAGVAAWRPGDSISMLLSRADSALYEAKRSGRNRTFVNAEDAVAVRELAQAVQEQQLVLHFQPKMHLRTGRITGFEALVRWEHPHRGLLPPSEFIPLAEDSGLIVELGTSVLFAACRQGAAWAQAFPEQPMEVAVNVAGRQLDDSAIVETVRRALTESGLAPALLTLEVTETMIGASVDVWADRLWELRRLGVQLALDDFGTGYSSLDQVRRLPVGTIKIDRSFVRDLTHSPETVAVVTAMIGIGQGLGRAVIAEGVETTEQLHELARLGCDEVQGFLIGRPLPYDEVEMLLRQQQRVHRLVQGVTAATHGDNGNHPTMHGVAELVDARHPLEQVVRPLLEHLVRVSGLESAYLTRIRWDVLEQEILLALNTGELDITEGLTVAWADTVCRQALEIGPRRTAAAPEIYADSCAVAELGLQSYATAPVVLGDGSVFGTLCVASRYAVDVRDELMALLSIYSRLISDQVGATEPAPSGSPRQ